LIETNSSPKELIWRTSDVARQLRFIMSFLEATCGLLLSCSNFIGHSLLPTSVFVPIPDSSGLIDVLQIRCFTRFQQLIINTLDILTETILLRNLKILMDTDLKIILLDHQNNFGGTLKIMSNAAQNFDILVRSFYIIILIVQQNYFSDLYPAKILHQMQNKIFFPKRLGLAIDVDDSPKFTHVLHFELS